MLPPAVKICVTTVIILVGEGLSGLIKVYLFIYGFNSSLVLIQSIQVF